MTEIDKLKRFIENVENLGYDADRAVKRLSEIEDFERETKQLQDRRDAVVKERIAEQELLAQTLAETSKASTELAGRKDEIAKAQVELNSIEREVCEKSHIITFAEAIRLLFSDTSRIPFQLLIELSVWIRLAVEAGLRPSPLPYDFESLRKKAVEVLELALGEKLVPRERFDELIRRTVEPQDDAMFDRLVKEERERAKFNEERAALVKIKQNLEWATVEKLLQVALNWQQKGFIGIHKCPSCERPLVATLAGTRYTVHNCPSCGYDAAPKQ